MRRRRAVVLVASAAVVLAAAPGAAYPRPGQTDRVSVTSAGTDARAESRFAAVSADGRVVAFASQAPDLVEGVTNGTWDVFVHDRETGVTERVSTAFDGSEPDDISWIPSVSADGRYVAFDSRATNLVPGDTNGNWDVFVHDRDTGETERVSVASDGTEGDQRSLGGVISADGLHVAFHSDATNLVPGDTNGARDVFVHDRDTGVTERVSVASDGTQSLGGPSIDPTMSADGRHVAFTSAASNLVPGDTNGARDVFVHDRDSEVTERVSVATSGAEGNGVSQAPSISADGGQVAFESFATTLVPGDRNDAPDIFVHDRDSGVTERVSVDSYGVEGAGASRGPTIGADGRHVAFHSDATNLAFGDTNGAQDIFVHDRQTRVTERVSVDAQGEEGNDGSTAASISGDGALVAFESDATNLVADDRNRVRDVFVRDRGPGIGIGGLSVTVSGDQADVSGWATFSGIDVSSSAKPAGDTVAGAVGAELLSATVLVRPEQEDLLVRIAVTEIPAARTTDGATILVGSAGIVYTVRFTTGGTTYELRAMPIGATAVPPSAPYVALFRCDPDCAETALLPGSIGATGDEVLVALPTEVLSLDDATLTDVAVSTAAGEAVVGSLHTLDELDLPDAVLAAPQVQLAVTPAGAPPGDADYDPVTALAGGAFSGAVDVSDLSSGSHRVWASACLADTCGSRSADITQ